MHSTDSPLPLPVEDYKRYGRQMILDGFGLQGQVKLSKASVAVIGAGGLGCAALPYLASAGVGTIGIFDHDTVEMSNLQRQILHTEEGARGGKAGEGVYKVDSAKAALQKINSSIRINTVTDAITSVNAAELLKDYTLLLDCTDNPPTRYLLSDTAVALGKVLVSGAAQRFDGQLAVYNFGPLDPAEKAPGAGEEARGPCYRCVFPTPPKQASVGSCEELGVLGPVVGTIGNLQAIEAIKILVGLFDPKPTMLIYNALSTPPFRSIKMRGRREGCVGCGAGRQSEIKETDYVQFCGGARPNWVESGMRAGRKDERITVQELRARLDNRDSEAFDLIDVRPATEFGICSLKGSRQVPLKKIVERPQDYIIPPADAAASGSTQPTTVVVLCRLGNDSQIAARAITEAGGRAVDVVGGLRAWSREVDAQFPIY